MKLPSLEAGLAMLAATLASASAYNRFTAMPAHQVGAPHQGVHAAPAAPAVSDPQAPNLGIRLQFNFPELAFETWVQRADTIVHGHVRSVEQHLNGNGFAYRIVELAVADHVTETEVPPVVFFTVPGGRVGATVTIANQAPSFEVGGEYLVMLDEVPGDPLRMLTAFGQTTFRIDGGLARSAAAGHHDTANPAAEPVDQLFRRIRTALQH